MLSHPSLPAVCHLHQYGKLRYPSGDLVQGCLPELCVAKNLPAVVNISLILGNHWVERLAPLEIPGSNDKHDRGIEGEPPDAYSSEHHPIQIANHSNSVTSTLHTGF